MDIVAEGRRALREAGPVWDSSRLSGWLMALVDMRRSARPAERRDLVQPRCSVLPPECGGGRSLPSSASYEAAKSQPGGWAPYMTTQ